MLSKPDFITKNIILVFTSNGDKISFKNDNIIVSDLNKKTKFQQSCYSIFAIFIVGEITLTSGIIRRSKKFGFSISLFTIGFKLYTTINNKLEGNTLLIKNQYSKTNELEIAKQIVINKIKNQKNTLRHIRDASIKDGIEKLESILERLNEGEHSISEIMGFEGMAAKVYFNRLFKNIDWRGRQPRIKRDPINLLLDIGYTVLFNYIETILNIYGFDVYKGNLHQEFYKRKSLVCDIIEPFRVMIDHEIRNVINLGQTKNYTYKIINNQYQLDWKDSQKYILIMLEKITHNREKIFLYIQKYYRWVMQRKDIKYFPEVVLYDNH